MPTQTKSLAVKIGILFVIIFVSLLNGHLQLNRQVNKIEDIFVNGINNDNLSIHYDLQKIDDSMSYFLSLAKTNHYTSENMTQIDQLHQRFEQNKEIKDYSEWYKEVKKVYPIAISELKEIQLSQQHKEMLSKYEATYNSSTHTIAYSPYNQYVREYEKETSGLLAKMIKDVTRVKKVATFD